MLAAQRAILNRFFARHFPGVAGVQKAFQNVLVYKFKNSWEEDDLEGRLFVCSGARGKPIRLAILAQNKPSNLDVAVSAACPVECHGRFVIVKHEGKETYHGFWMGNERDAVDLCRLCNVPGAM